MATLGASELSLTARNEEISFRLPTGPTNSKNSKLINFLISACTLPVVGVFYWLPAAVVRDSYIGLGCISYCGMMGTHELCCLLQYTYSHLQLSYHTGVCRCAGSLAEEEVLAQPWSAAGCLRACVSLERISSIQGMGQFGKSESLLVYARPMNNITSMT